MKKRLSWAILFMGALSMQSQIIWINEIHYDNISGDTNEFIEIAGGAGTDLDGYKVVLYNGSTGGVYGNINLTGLIPNQNNGYGTVHFLETGIQNGAPDGLALVDPNDNVLQFLSYEGTFTALGGAADGMLSTDIGVQETNSTPVGFHYN